MTASEAEEAVSKAEGLTKAMDAAEKLQGAQLDAEIAGLRQVYFRLCQSSPPAFLSVAVRHTYVFINIVSASFDIATLLRARCSRSLMTSLVQSIDKAALPAAAKAALRNRLAALQKRVLEDQKAAAAANKAQATAAAVEAADSSAAAGQKHVVLQLEVRALVWVCLQRALTADCKETLRCCNG